jgi:hypothetical protein
VSPIELTERRGGGRGVAKSYDVEKTWPSIHQSILSGLKVLGKNIYLIQFQAVRIGGNFAPLATSKRAKKLNIIAFIYSIDDVRNADARMRA